MPSPPNGAVSRRLMTRPLTNAMGASGMPPAALFGLLATEGGSMGEVSSNTNGTWDLGCFQINTFTSMNWAMGIETLFRTGRRRHG